MINLLKWLNGLNSKQFLTVLVLAIFVLGFIPVFIANHVSRDEVVFTVTDKERINSGGSSYYLIFTDKGQYKNVDSWLALKFDSSDLYGKLVVGKTYKCQKNFWRVKLLSMYENLLSCEMAESK